MTKENVGSEHAGTVVGHFVLGPEDLEVRGGFVRCDA